MAARRSRALGQLPKRRRVARDVLDRRVAARRGLADVHGRAARPLECGPHGGGHLRTDRPRALDPRGRGGDHARPRRPRAAPPVRPGRDRTPAPGPGGRHAPRGRARRRTRRGAAGRVRHGDGARPGRLAPGLRRGARAGGQGQARAASHVRPAGRCVCLHPAALPGARMSWPRAERPAHRCTTRHAQAIYPFVAGGSLGGRGVFIGRDSSGGAFCYDPWVLYGDGTLDDPNAIVLGKLGQGKSALVKTLLWRMLLFGRRAFVLDVKREYGPLCDAIGVKPISLVPGGGVRLNPLASRPEEHAQLELLRAVTVTALGGALTQVEAAALREALRTVRTRAAGEPTLPQIAAVLFEPVGDMAARLQTSVAQLATDARRAALALQD